MYQRSKIQEESLYYETLKHTSIGINIFLSSKGSPKVIPAEVIKYKMQEMGMKAKDLEPIIGSKGHVSAILSGNVKSH